MNDFNQLDRLGHYTPLAQQVDGLIRTTWPNSPIEPRTRGFKALEEVLEINQVLGLSAEKAHILVDYVFGRPVGEIRQEAGGVAFTIQALFNALGFNFEQMVQEGLDDCRSRIETIRIKSKSKPKVD